MAILAIIKKKAGQNPAFRKIIIELLSQNILSILRIVYMPQPY
jgi:hypothetical protein